jgi:predicted DNA-binding transcriptional regulator AlpA
MSDAYEAAIEPFTRKAEDLVRPPMTGPVLTTRSAAEYCGIAEQTLYNLVSQGAGPKRYKRGRLNAFYAGDLDNWNRARLRPADELQ